MYIVVELTKSELTEIRGGSNCDNLLSSGFNPLDGKSWFYVDTSVIGSFLPM